MPIPGPFRLFVPLVLSVGLLTACSGSPAGGTTVTVTAPLSTASATASPTPVETTPAAATSSEAALNLSLESSKGAEVRDSEGYTFRAQYQVGWGKPYTSSANDRPGYTSIAMDGSPGVGLYNTTAGHNLPVPTPWIFVANYPRSSLPCTFGAAQTSTLPVGGVWTPLTDGSCELTLAQSGLSGANTTIGAGDGVPIDMLPGDGQQNIQTLVIGGVPESSASSMEDALLRPTNVVLGVGVNGGVTYPGRCTFTAQTGADSLSDGHYAVVASRNPVRC